MPSPTGSTARPRPTPLRCPPGPAPPATAVAAGIEGRGELWAQTVKNNPDYMPGTIGATLRLEATAAPFNPGEYTARMNDLSSPSAKQLRFKFGKASGKIDGVNLYGRKVGATDFINLGRYTAAPANAMIPLTGDAPEEWEFEVRAVKRDIEIGSPSP